VDAASYDTWIKQYRADENTPNTTIDYYPKGAVIAFLLDARIRMASGGTKTLDDAMQAALQRYGGAKGYTPQFYQVMAEVSGADLNGFFTGAVESAEELQYTEALDYYGLRFRPVDPRTRVHSSARSPVHRTADSLSPGSGEVRRLTTRVSTPTTRFWPSTVCASARMASSPDSSNTGWATASRCWWRAATS
jgi:M61 glycyl aminopeptidase